MKKKILLAVIALIVLCLLGGGGFFGYKWWARRKAAQAAAQAAVTPAPAQDDDEDEPEASGGEKEGASAPAVLQLKGLIVNLESPRKNAWLKCEIDILFRDKELAKLAAGDKPTPENSVIRSIVLEAVSGMSVDVAMDVESRDNVRQQIKDKLNEKFASHRSKEALEKARKSGKPLKPPIRDVLVVEWAIQQ